jgi:hypothetical protein
VRGVLFDFVNACNAAHEQKKLEKAGTIGMGAYDRFDLASRRRAEATATADRTLAAFEEGFDEYVRLFADSDLRMVTSAILTSYPVRSGEYLQLLLEE